MMMPVRGLRRPLPGLVMACLLLLAGNPASAATLEVVKAGVPKQLVSSSNPAGKPPSADGAVGLADFRGSFPVTAKLGGTFTAKIRMAVVKAKNAGASIVLNGDSHFGFYGGQRRMFLAGPLFKGVVLDRPTPDPVLAGQPFDIEITRAAAVNAATLTFRIDGEVILTLDAAPAVESLGFRPSHSEIRITSMTIDGDVSPVALASLPKSDDGGLTWRRIDDAMPPNYRNFKNCPSLYRIPGPDGKERPYIFASRTLKKNENPADVPGRLEGSMPRVVSEDGGTTWREVSPLSPTRGPDARFQCVMTFSSMVRLKDGSTLALYHDRLPTDTVLAETVMQTVSKDGGIMWSNPRPVAGGGNPEGKDPCEPYVFRSPDGGELCCIMRENMRTGTSLVMFSPDEGATWSDPVPTPWGLTGDRHQGVQLPDGRLVIVFRNGAPGSEDRFVAWVGTYDDIKHGRPGQYTVALLNGFSDGGYPGIHLLPDGTIVATTYASLAPQEKPSIVSIRFTISEIDPCVAQDDEPRDLKKPEVDMAAKGAKRAWESAPAASKALWLEHREALTHVDLSTDEQRQVIVARGTTEADAYHAHPATAMLADGRTIFCVWNIGHGGHAGPIARSDDAGLTWHRIDGVMPPNYVNFKGGIIFRITDAHGKDRLWVFSGKTAVGKDEVINDFPGRLQGYVPRMVSEDDGKTWREEPPLGPGRLAKDEPFRCVFAFSTILPLKDGSHLGMFHRAAAAGGAATLQVMQSVTRDGGFTWSEPVVACDGTKLAGKDPCEPYVFRSPDGGELCCLMRENKRSGTSLVMFSRDEGQTWSEAVDAPWGLTGDRHHGIRLPDGRLVIVFRHAAPNAKDRGLIAWVGTYDDIKQGKPGQYRVSLIKTFKDGLYPGLHLLPDGTILATTYASLGPQENPSIVSIRFTIAEVDALAAKAEKQ